MSFSVPCLLKKQHRLLTVMCVRHRSQRRNLGKPPGIAKTLAERLEGKLFSNLFIKNIIILMKKE